MGRKRAQEPAQGQEGPQAPARQPPQEPGIYRLSPGQWRVRVAVRHAGRIVQRERLVEGKLPQAREAREGLRRELLLDLEEAPVSGVTPRSTVAAYAEHWLRARAPRLKPSTRDRYVGALSQQILPRLGHLRLDRLTRADVEAWTASTEALRLPSGDPYSRHTLSGWWRILTEVLRDAAAELHLPDPTARVKGPTSAAPRKREMRTLTREEVGSLLAWLAEHRPAWHDEVFLMFRTGMRPGELYALTWDQVDLERGQIHIDRAHWRGDVATPKTDDPRVVALTRTMVDLLRVRRARMLREQQPGIERGLVFPSARGELRIANSALPILVEAAEHAGIDVHVTPQVVRRTFNTQLLEAGVDRITIRAQMGHVSEAMTERYAGVAVERKRAAVEALEGED